jgi:hypothetical protein
VIRYLPLAIVVLMIAALLLLGGIRDHDVDLGYAAAAWAIVALALVGVGWAREPRHRGGHRFRR